MEVLVMSDAHIVKDINTGTYWCRTAVHGYDFWQRYLEIFDEVNVVARVKYVRNIDKILYTKADGPGVRFTELPFVRGTKGYLINYFKLRQLFKGIIKEEDCAIFRLPSLPTFMLLDEFKKTRRPYAIEVVVDPHDAYKSNVFAQKLLTYRLKRECMQANGVSYVTQFFLQEKYPCYSILNGQTNNYFDSFYSSIKLEKSFFGQPRNYYGIENRRLNLIHISSAINSDVKGHTTLLNIIKKLKLLKIDVHLKCIGDGDKRSYYENMAKELNIDDSVTFLGLFSDKNKLRKELENSDFLIFPTQAEGLPRVVIEAMSVGLPCLSTPVNGIPELINEENLFDPFDTEGFVKRIIELKYNYLKMNEISYNNIQRALEYEDSVLKERRNIFYSKLRDVVEEKLK